MPPLPKLKRLRENYPLTVRELEDKSGVSRITIGNIENHGQSARPSTVRKLAGALGMKPRELIDADRRSEGWVDG
jgi:transcriptional regulator with XRE-family HTH domain